MIPNNHSLSLGVKDIHASMAYYKKLGFEPAEGTGFVKDKWILMSKERSHTGLYQDMVKKNIISFDPEDARTFYKNLKSKGFNILMESDFISDVKGLCHFCISNPYVNQTLFDQHDN